MHTAKNKEKLVVDVLKVMQQIGIDPNKFFLEINPSDNVRQMRIEP